MGNVIDYARLSNEVYESNGGAPGNGWQVLLRSSDASIGADSGYFGVAYYHEATGELVIAHRGTEPNTWNDWRTNAELIVGQIPAQFQDAEQFYEYVHEQAANDERQINQTTQTGHSLGGAIARMIGIM